MNRKGLWALAAVLACGALVQLTIAASQPAAGLTDDQHKALIRDQRKVIETWLNQATGDTKKVIQEKAVTINQKDKVVGRGRAKIEDKWKALRGHHADRNIKFEIIDIQLIPASMMRQGPGSTWTKYDRIAVEFGTFTFLSRSDAERGPSDVQPQPDGEYWAIWEHKDDCTWEIAVEIEM